MTRGSRMRLCIDARAIYREKRRGTGKNLIDLYTLISEYRPDWEIVMLHRDSAMDRPFSNCVNVSARAIDITGGWLGLWPNVRLPLELLATGADLLHAPANIGPYWPGRPMVATIHDLIPLEPHLATPASTKWGERVRRTARTAKKILTPSEFSKRRIVEFCGIPDEKVVVNPWAPDRNCRRIDDSAQLAAVRAKYGLIEGQRYAFGFAAEDPRKNTERVLRGWAKLPQTVRRDCRLLLVGIQDVARARFQQLADELDLGDSCRLHGFADEEDIAPLLSGASLLVFPSLSEGFGLPVLDAFVCGAAVLTSNVSSLPEVAGDAALLVDPTRIDEIADGMRQLLTDDPFRQELVARGAARGKQFTWEACAQRVINVFEEVTG